MTVKKNLCAKRYVRKGSLKGSLNNKLFAVFWFKVFAA